VDLENEARRMNGKKESKKESRKEEIVLTPIELPVPPCLTCGSWRCLEVRGGS